MLTKTEKMLEYIDKLPFDAVRKAWVTRCLAENGRSDSLHKSLLEDGFERVIEVGPITADGREILHIRNRSYALRKDVHTERFSAAILRAQKSSGTKTVQPNTENEKQVVGTESLSKLVCPHCGDAIESSALCPACEAAKLGYKYKYACACGKVDFISKVKSW